MTAYAASLIRKGEKKAKIRSVVILLKNGIDEEIIKTDYPDEFEEGKAEYLRMKKQEE